MIDKSGSWWKGEDVDDLVEYLGEYTSRQYPAGEYRRCRCAGCGGTVFGLVVDDDDGVAQRVCRSCDAEHLIADSGDHWEHSDAGDAACVCESEDFEVAVAYSLIDRGELRWITVGARCTACGLLGVYVEWKIDYEPSRHLLDRA